MDYFPFPPSCSEKIEEFIWLLEAALSKKLGVREYPIPNNPSIYYVVNTKF